MFGTVFASSIGFGVFATLKNKLKSWLFSPEPVSIHQVIQDENFDLIQQNGKYCGWRLRREYNPRNSVVFLMHGNSGCAMDYFEPMKEKFPGADIVCVEYPGFGWNYNKGETPTIESCAKHVRSFYEWYIRNQYRNIYVVAYSIGTVVAAQAFEYAMMEKIRAFILVSPIDNINSVIYDNTSIPQFVINFLLGEEPTLEYWKKTLLWTKLKFFVFIGNRDEVVKPERSLHVVRSIPADRVEVFFLPVGHADLLPKISDNLWKRIHSVENLNL